MSFIGRLKGWALVVFAAAVLVLGSITAAFAQVSGSDADGLDGDEFSAVAILLAVVAIGGVGWAAYHRRSTRPR